MNKTPNPGSKEAIEKGCTCPVLDNAHGQDTLINLEVCFWYTRDCPVHSKNNQEKKK